MNAEERAELRIDHQQVSGGLTWCRACHQNYPCDVTRLLDALEAAEALTAPLTDAVSAALVQPAPKVAHS